MKIKNYLFLVLIIPLLSFTMHKYYLSLCEIEYVEEKQSIQIIIGFFIDDIELTLNKDNNTKLKLATKDEAPNIDQYFETYLNNNFKLAVNNNSASYTYIGKEYDDDIVRFYLEITDVKVLNSIDIYNTCLIRDFEDQQNIIKIYANNIQKTFYLNNKTLKALLKF
ncbi:hypothetical protein MHL31_03830 [Lutibacter sp. A80]|uniref:DUF6702 family protein n=1 Tax=Lutibacter sp. A80 TaxID=2918453 RepID=UPI001F061EAC|nr:DUF6702 family protein [Lutibacter sp. A80]UMB61338.1 hypothetical protein MHL31_03830 [Lutibacter sp. A80]